jgi:hypothetical protein
MNGLPVIATKNGAPVEINQVCVPYDLYYAIAINVRSSFQDGITVAVLWSISM